MIEEQFVSFDTAKMLKEAGFDEVCRSAYYATGNSAVMHERNSMLSPGYISRPTQALAARWLREKHDTFVKMERVGSFDGKEFRFYWSYSLICVYTACLNSISGGRYDSYEEALEAGIMQVLERIISETKG